MSSVLAELSANQLLVGAASRHAFETQIRELHKQAAIKEAAMKEMREELNDALNEITLLTRIRNEEKRISSERYMQLQATKAQLDAAHRDLSDARKELRFSARTSTVSNNLNSELMNDMSLRLNQQKSKHAEELRESALCIEALEQELHQVQSGRGNQLHELQEQIALLGKDRDLLVARLKETMLEIEAEQRRGDEARAASANAREELDRLRSELTKCQQDLSKTLKRATQAEGRVKEAEETLRRCKQQHSDAAAEAETYSVSFRTTKREHEHVRAKVERLQGELDAADEELREARCQASHLSIELVRSESERRRLCTEIEHLSGLVDSYRRGGMHTRRT